VVRRLGRALAGRAEVVRAGSGATPGTDATVVVVDAGAADAPEQVRALRHQQPDLVIAACISVPDRRRWEELERAGADLVVNQGALGHSLLRLFDQLDETGRRRRFALFDAGEVAGRLGLITAVADTPVGPVAVFRAGTGLACVADTCPHAGARLSEGPYENGVVTCPAHGSQFDVLTGERRRGPADSPIGSFTVTEGEGRVWLHWV
jgi:nitrite reductase/ring-hydroxylating ferredoxin subunit